MKKLARFKDSESAIRIAETIKNEKLRYTAFAIIKNINFKERRNRKIENILRSMEGALARGNCVETIPLCDGMNLVVGAVEAQEGLLLDALRRHEEVVDMGARIEILKVILRTITRG